MSFKQIIVAGFLVTTAVILAPVVVGDVSTHAQDVKTTAQERQATVQANLAEKKAVIQTRLADTKLKVCQNREKAIGNIMARMSDRGTKQLDVFTKIYNRVQAFYLEKGKTLDNYAVLSSEADSAKLNAESAALKAKETSVTFKCDGTDPKGLARTFKEALKLQNEALKAYKTAIKNLIVGVKSVQGTESSTKNQNTQGVQ